MWTMIQKMHRMQGSKKHSMCVPKRMIPPRAFLNVPSFLKNLVLLNQTLIRPPELSNSFHRCAYCWRQTVLERYLLVLSLCSAYLGWGSFAGIHEGCSSRIFWRCSRRKGLWNRREREGYSVNTFWTSYIFVQEYLQDSKDKVSPLMPHAKNAQDHETNHA